MHLWKSLLGYTGLLTTWSISGRESVWCCTRFSGWGGEVRLCGDQRYFLSRWEKSWLFTSMISWKFLQGIDFVNHPSFYSPHNSLNNVPPFSCSEVSGSAVTPSQPTFENICGHLPIPPTLQITAGMECSPLQRHTFLGTVQNSSSDGQYDRGRFASLLHPTVKQTLELGMLRSYTMKFWT